MAGEVPHQGRRSHHGSMSVITSKKGSLPLFARATAPPTTVALTFGTCLLLRLGVGFTGACAEEGVHIGDQLAGKSGVVAGCAACYGRFLLRLRIPLWARFRLPLRTAL